jgi:two-component system nitrogen regulation response regulator GlnG
MSPGQVIHLDDLPPELLTVEQQEKSNGDWTEALRYWADRQLSNGDSSILDQAVPMFEKVMIEIALQKASGRRQDAAKLLGWGRNTLTRKIKELDMNDNARA